MLLILSLLIICIHADVEKYFDGITEGTICYSEDTQTFMTYNKFPYDDHEVVVPEQCGKPPSSVSVNWVGKIDNASYYEFRPDSTIRNYTIVQDSRPSINPEKECLSDINFTEGNNLRAIRLNEVTRRAGWRFSNKYLVNDFDVYFGKREGDNVWAPTNIVIESTNSLIIHIDSYEYFQLYKYVDDAFVLFIPNYDVATRTGSKTYIRTIKINETQECVYQYTSYQLNVPGVDNSSFKMVDICSNGGYTRYVQCFWSKNRFRDCNCKPVYFEKEIKTSGNLRYPDCHYLSEFFTLTLSTNNSYVEFDTNKTTHWLDIFIPQGMNSLIFNVTAYNEITKNQTLIVDSDFTLPAFS